MSRVEALDMISRLLDNWRVEHGTRTNEISLIDQVESELEMRFLNKLMAWAGEPDSPVRIEKRTDLDGARIAELWFTAPNRRDVTHWQMKLQNTIRGSRPDVHFKRLDAASPEVAVFLDGFKYHASTEYNRLADDADKRAQLRAHDYVVFGITWEDVDSWGKPADDSSRAPYGGLAQQAARSVYRQLVPDSDPHDLERYVWTNPVDLLMHFLANPDPRLWCRRAEAALAGMLAIPADKTVADSSGIGTLILAALRGDALPPAAAGNITLVRGVDSHGCPLIMLIDSRTSTRIWSALAVIDDRPAAVLTDDGHQRRWASWLYWGNLIQFLTDAGGDGAQLTRTTLDSFDPAQLAVTEGTGFVLAKRAVGLDDETATWLGRVTEPPPEVPEAAVADSGWQKVLRYYDREESGLETLVRDLIDRHLPAPVVGYELGEQMWPAELAWPDRRLAIVVSGLHDDPEIGDRDHAYAAAGWRAKTAREWTADELSELIHVTDGGGSR